MSTIMLSGQCDFCLDLHEAENNHSHIYDGKTKFGHWAWMCESHFKELGMGKGQEYKKQADGTRLKVH